jgi:hypothetical protein
LRHSHQRVPDQQGPYISAQAHEGQRTKIGRQHEKKQTRTTTAEMSHRHNSAHAEQNAIRNLTEACTKEQATYSLLRSFFERADALAVKLQLALPGRSKQTRPRMMSVIQSTAAHCWGTEKTNESMPVQQFKHASSHRPMVAQDTTTNKRVAKSLRVCLLPLPLIDSLQPSGPLFPCGLAFAPVPPALPAFIDWRSGSAKWAT